MDLPPEINPSLLEYAQVVGIVKDPSTFTPDCYLRDSGIHEGFSPTVPQNIDSMQARYEEFSSLFDSVFENEKLDISMQEAELLSEVRQLERQIPCPDWNTMLHPLPGASSSRNELFLVTQKEEEGVESLRNGDDVEMLDLITSSTLDKESAGQQPRKETVCMTGQPHPHGDLDGRPVRTRSHESIFQGDSACLGDTLMPENKNDSIFPDDKLPQSQAGETWATSHSMRDIASLGSLATYMETRGIMTSTDASTSTRPFFDQDHEPAASQARLVLPSTRSALDISLPPAIPQNHRHSSEDLALYFSSDLLRTHLPLVQHLEMMRNHPHIVYRDYNPDEGVEDADIIIPPATGIILTHVQALTQQNLPGDEILDGNPVMGRVRRLASRYQYFYVLVGSDWTGNRTVVDATCSLKGLCESLSSDVAVIPLLVPFDKMAEWVLALAFERFERG